MGLLTRNPLMWILLAAAGLRLAGLAWGLPASDGWDDDGFAPRNFLTALALTWKHGAYFTYPPLQALLMAILTLPAILLALLHAPSFHQVDVIGEFIKPGYMTFFAVMGRLVSLAMSLAIVWILGEMTRLVAGRRAGLFAAAASALHFGLTYYGQVSNLDVPYLFWGLLGLLCCIHAVMEQKTRFFMGAALCAAASIATKDQAYGLYILSVPLFLLLWFGLDTWPRSRVRQLLLTLLVCSAVALVLLLLVDGAITNLSGFLRRIAFLTGPASKDYAEYVGGPVGWLALLGDMARYFLQGAGLVAVPLAFLGLALQITRSRGAALAASLLPALAIISFTLCFNFAALRSDDRFLMPQGLLACIYIGIAAETLAFAAQAWTRLAGRCVLAGAALVALHQAIAIDAAMLFDPRYEAQSWLGLHARPGDVVETYGQNCFLPRFPQGARVTRIGQGDLKGRNPLPGVVELKQSFSAPRNPRFIVVSTAWAWRYLRPQMVLAPGHIYSALQQADFRNRDARDYFSRLANQKLGYRLALVARYRGLWPLVHIHDSLDEAVWIFERSP
jgi:hypothetical protein